MSTAGPHIAASPLLPQLASVTLKGLRMGLIGELWVGFLLATQVLYSLRYFHLYGGPKGDSRLLQAYVAVTLLLGLNFAAANTALAWAMLTEGVLRGIVDPMRIVGLTSYWIWSLSLFASVGSSYWAWRAWRVSEYRAVRYVALVGWVASGTAFVVFAGLVSGNHRLQLFTLEQVQIAALIAVWIGTLNCVWCGGGLMYELGWKRRAAIARSSVLDAFVNVALATSGLIALVTLGAAICITIAMRDSNLTASYAFFLLCCGFAFASVACAVFTLNHRDTLRNPRDGSSGSGAVAARPAWREPRSATTRRTARLDADDLLYADSAVAFDGKRDDLGGDPYSREERAADFARRRLLVFPAPLAALTRGHGYGEERRERNETRRERNETRRSSEAEERGPRTVDVVVVRAERCEPAADDDDVKEGLGLSGSQQVGTLETSPNRRRRGSWA